MKTRKNLGPAGCPPTTDQRALYRIEALAKEGICATILAPGLLPVTGRLTDVSSDGAGVEVAPEPHPVVPVGQAVQLILLGGQVMKPLTVAALVRHRRRERKGERNFHRYGVEFIDKDGLDESLIAQALFSLFNRRGSYRAMPDPAFPIGVQLSDEGEGARILGMLKDLSNRGMGVLVNPKAERSFADIEEVGIALQLPTREEPVHLTGAIRYRNLEGAFVRYGIEFDPVKDGDAEGSRTAIREYIVSRHDDLLVAVGELDGICPD